MTLTPVQTRTDRGVFYTLYSHSCEEREKQEYDVPFGKFEEMYNRQIGTATYICKVKDTAVGYAIVKTHPHTLTPEVVDLMSVYVLPEYRHRGYGRNSIRLMAELYDGKSISLTVPQKNVKLENFFYKGFLTIGYTDRFNEFSIEAKSQNAIFHLYQRRALS